MVLVVDVKTMDSMLCSQGPLYLGMYKGAKSTCAEHSTYLSVHSFSNGSTPMTAGELTTSQVCIFPHSTSPILDFDIDAYCESGIPKVSMIDIE